MSNINAASFAQPDKNNSFSMNLLVDGMHCPSCVAIIENALHKQQEITQARLNLSTKRLRINWQGAKEKANDWVELINRMGYKAVPFDPSTSESQSEREEKFLLRCLAVAGFASGNLMLFSVPIWSADMQEMGSATRTMFYWIQALIAIPAIAYSGQPFFRSAWRALKDWHTNMDVPISVAVILATLMSLFETATHGRHAYFDSGVMLLFFLLIGRYLDARARGRARSAAHDLLQMMTGQATQVLEDGKTQQINLSEIKEGMTLLVAAGEKIGADAQIVSGDTDIDTSLITGESLPQQVGVGSKVYAGTINLAAPITLKVLKAGERSLLAEIIRLMETAEQSQAQYVSIADAISGWYTPLVHLLAAITFAGWLLHGLEWQLALLYAATVLIITCPCALGLAVPAVQVLAIGRLMREGVLIKSGSALERLSQVTHVVFDKTGTLTIGKPTLINKDSIPQSAFALAASMASHSRHPLSQALSGAYSGSPLSVTPREVKGHGIETNYRGKLVRLGKRDWCGVLEQHTDEQMELWLSIEGEPALRFLFEDTLRGDAEGVVTELKSAGFGVTLLSGDRESVVKSVAQRLHITDARASMLPAEKCTVLEQFRASGQKVLMVGDGLNDAPSLAMAHVSMSPSSAMDITQNAADIVFQGNLLKPVKNVLDIAKFSQVLVRQNFALSLLYNVFAIPLAVMGYVTPLIAAIAMSSSSLLVIANALRLNLSRGKS